MPCPCLETDTEWWCVVSGGSGEEAELRRPRTHEVACGKLDRPVVEVVLFAGEFEKVPNALGHLPCPAHAGPKPAVAHLAAAHLMEPADDLRGTKRQLALQPFGEKGFDGSR